MKKALASKARDRGTAALEFALVAPLLLALVFGIIDFGRMAAVRISLTGAARAAAQAYAISGLSGDASTAASQAYGPGGPVTVTPVRACPPNPGTSDSASVQVHITFHFITPLGFLIVGSTASQNQTMTATGVVPCRA